ncbi:MAG: hypothetical protein WBI63_09740 [Coriobacteriia bacterium]
MISTARQAGHGSFTHGKLDDMVQAGDDSDFIYVSGHGWYGAYLPIYAYGARESSLPYDSISPDQSASLDFDAAEAARRAEDFLRSNGEFPADAVCAEVSAVMGVTFDFESDRPEVMQPVEYEVRFMQQLGDAFVDGDGAGLLVCLDGQGVREVYKKWFSADSKSHGSGAHTPNPKRALESGLMSADRQMDLPDQVTVNRMNMVYYPDLLQDGTAALVPAWRIELEDGSAVFVDADTNEPLGD